MNRWTICSRCANEGACNPCDPVEVAPASLALSEEERGVIDWYVHCLENVAARRTVRGLDEAKVGYERVMRKFLSAEAAAR